jgi:hypothetical protein
VRVLLNDARQESGVGAIRRSIQISSFDKEGGAISQKVKAMNTNKDNTQLPFQSRKKIGQSVEREFLELIAVMGGTAILSSTLHR